MEPIRIGERKFTDGRNGRRNVNFRQLITIVKRIFPDRCKIRRKYDCGQRAAAVEGIIFNFRNIIGDINNLQIFTTIESLFSNICNSIRDKDGFQIFTEIKRVISYRSYSVRNGDAFRKL